MSDPIFSNCPHANKQHRRALSIEGFFFRQTHTDAVGLPGGRGGLRAQRARG